MFAVVLPTSLTLTASETGNEKENEAILLEENDGFCIKGIRTVLRRTLPQRAFLQRTFPRRYFPDGQFSSRQFPKRTITGKSGQGGKVKMGESNIVLFSLNGQTSLAKSIAA